MHVIIVDGRRVYMRIKHTTRTQFALTFVRAQMHANKLLMMYIKYIDDMVSVCIHVHLSVFHYFYFI